MIRTMLRSLWLLIPANKRAEEERQAAAREREQNQREHREALTARTTWFLDFLTQIVTIADSAASQQEKRKLLLELLPTFNPPTQWEGRLKLDHHGEVIETTTHPTRNTHLLVAATSYLLERCILEADTDPELVDWCRRVLLRFRAWYGTALSDANALKIEELFIDPKQHK